ncbi:MAG: FMN-binding protein [Defluviitaleaceae bacterium]|nr:FMN-binding protein [Defluviitaleaceae bacterium]
MKFVLKPAIVLFIVASATVILLTFVHSATLEPIAAQARRMREIAAIEVLPFASMIEEVELDDFDGITNVFVGLNDGLVIGYAIEAYQLGYSGRIDIMVGISVESEQITGIRILRHTETPGLGSLVTREVFYGQFYEAPLMPLRVVRSGADGADEINSITGATITAVAVTEAVNRAIEWYSLIGGSLR